MTDLSALSPGQIISMSDGRLATVRFVGNTHFAPGEWIGIELEDATGKNDGAVQGERYFDCDQGYGMFIRPPAIAAIIEQPTREGGRVNGKTANGAAIKARPSSGVPGAGTTGKRQSILASAAGRRQSVAAASPTPGAKGALASRGLRSPTKSPTKQISSPAASGTSTPRTSTPSIAPRNSTGGTKPRPSTGSRMSMGPPIAPPTSSRLSCQSLAGPPNKASRGGIHGSTTSSNGAARHPSIKPTTTPRPGTERVESRATDRSEETPPIEEQDEDVKEGPPGPSADDESRNPLTPIVSHPSESSVAISSPKQNFSRPLVSPTLTQQSLPRVTTGGRELEDLKAKLRVMEKKRMEDREKLKTLERTQAERDKFEGIIQKLQTKYQPQQQEINDLRGRLKDAEARAEDVERQQAEHDTAVEMAALDREMAEETAEALKTELEALKIKAEELELQVEVLREENQELGQVMTPEEKSSQGWLQMEKSNERLREALIRLRDMTQQQEADLRSQIKELEDDVQDFANVRTQYETTKEKLLVSETNFEDLRQQLETALGAEEMIEELTEKNMQYQEQMDNFRATIEDLESLKELNDELEANHVETEKQLQEEIEFKESLHGEQTRKVALQDEVIEDLEYTLGRFRELVTNLQSDLEDMRSSQQITELEANELMNRSRAMIDLNMKLRASASKTQVKAIDMELRRIEAQECANHLAIVQVFLPESFVSERDPVLALLRFKRVGFKASLMHNVVRDRIADQATGPQQDVFAAYDVLEKLTWISSLCDRFVNFMSGCSVDEFSKCEGALYDLEPVERALNSWIEGLKKNELNEKQCALELQRSIALLSHLAETLVPDSLEAYADVVHMQALLMQSYLENTATALSHIKTLVQSKTIVTDGDEEATYFGQKVDMLVSQARSAKVIVGKVARSLADLKSRSLSLGEDTSSPFMQSEELARSLSEFTRRLGEDILFLFSDEGRTESFTYPEIHQLLSKSATSFFQSSSTGNSNDTLSTFATQIRTLVSSLEDLNALSSDLSRATEFERRSAPWLVRAQELKSSKVIPPDLDDEIRRLKTDVQEQSNALGIKDRTLEEQGLKIELLESRMRDSGKKAAWLKELEVKVEGTKARERQLLEAIEAHARQVKNVENERDEYKLRLERAKRESGTEHGGQGGMFVPQDQASAVATAKEVEGLRTEIASLQAAIRFLREDNRRARLHDPKSPEHTSSLGSWLDTPLVRRKKSPEIERVQNTAAECQDVLAHLLRVSTETRIVDLKAGIPQEAGKRLAWRPIRSTPKYQVLRQREEFEKWVEWRDDVLKRERDREREVARKRLGSQPRRQIVEADQEVKPVANGSMMGKAWRMLERQRSGDSKTGGAPGKVEIVTSP